VRSRNHKGAVIAQELPWFLTMQYFFIEKNAVTAESIHQSLTVPYQIIEIWC
jgi:hypothetical protein